MATAIRRPRAATPARWQKALQRALDGQVQVRQLAGSGAWIATSASDGSTAYELEITGEIAHGCSCLAGLNGDPVCLHKAMYYHQIGALDLDPEPPTPAPLIFTGRGRTVHVVERSQEPGKYDILDLARKQRWGMAGPLPYILDKLTHGGFVAA